MGKIVKTQRSISLNLNGTTFINRAVQSLLLANTWTEMEESALALAQGVHEETPIINPFTEGDN